MSRSTRFALVVCSFSVLTAFMGAWFTMAADLPPAAQRQKAAAAFAAGNFRDALEIYKVLTLDPENAGETLGGDLSKAVQCLRQLQRSSEIDSLLHQVVAVHPGDWMAGYVAAMLLNTVEHHGFIVAGEFQRGSARGGGAFVDVSERDRVQSLIWLNLARQLMPAEATADQKANFFRDFATVLMNHGQNAWKLQTLTSLDSLPDYPESTQRFRGRWGGGNSAPAAPVDEQGQPIFYSVPVSFEAAKNDGERWRWCLVQRVEANPAQRGPAQLELASFLRQQFGVQTLQSAGINLSGDADGAQPADGVWSLSSLSDDETIARLASGVKRFKLPDEFNFIQIYKTLAQSTDEASAKQALTSLADIYTNRLQYEKAAAIWKDAIKRFPGYREVAQARLDQIIGNWGDFEPARGSAAGVGAEVDYKFRNGTSVTFTARKIKVPELIADIKAYIESRPAELDWQRLQIDQIGYQIVENNNTKYVGDEVAAWTLKLDPRQGHFDKRVAVTTPLQAAGAYYVTARMADGNTSRIILWINDTAIVRKNLNDQILYYVADAASGQPIEKAHVEFFGWRHEYGNNRNRQSVKILTQKFAEFADANGMLAINQKLVGENYQWLTVAKTDSGRFAYLGFSGVWFPKYQNETYDQPKAYFITDRPVYRPDQKVELKVWVRQASYGKVDPARYARQTFKVIINDPQGNEVFNQELVTDDFGGLQGEYALPKQAMLGAYSVQIQSPLLHTGVGSFRVEEYKKPEFEVTVTAPEKPVQLGEKITATITAKYYYGAAVTNGTVKYKVQRTAKHAEWFPFDRWDWLYGNGYWWFAPEAKWYPGFRSWGCFPPFPGGRSDPPELVLEQEVPVGADGTVKVEIDTSIAKALHGDEDHEYSITAEVTDASRRTIVGSGTVLVSRQPYKIFSWTDRGYYHVGDTIEARFQARSLDGKGVAGSGKLELLKITYADGKPVEQVVQTWELTTNSDGEATQSIKASEAGQYRVSFKMQTAPDAPVIEGGYLFTVRGEGFDGSRFQFNDLEIIADKKNYAPGDKVQLAINTNRTDATVLLFVRPLNGIAKTIPQVLKLNGKSTIVELNVAEEDMPNFFVEALTIARGEVFDQIRELMVPPVERVLNVTVVPSTDKYLPGQEAEVRVNVTDINGKPFAGALVLSVYDRALEYISGGSNVGNIKDFFWKWKRSHHIQSEDNLQQFSQTLHKSGETIMQQLGVFGDQVADLGNRMHFFQDDQPVKMMRSRGGMGGGMGGMAMPAAAPMSKEQSESLSLVADGAAAPGAPADVAPQIRSQFADTAFWKADLLTDAEGHAKVTFKMPENLSAWKIKAWGMGSGTNVGEGAIDVVTRKNIVVRLQAPRFFVERDEVVLSAVVHNYLETEKDITVQLDLEGDCLKLITDAAISAFKLEPSLTVKVPAGGETRVDWLVKAAQAGIAKVTMKALTNEESDAMQMTFPVEVHGILKTESFAGVIRPDANSGVIEFTVPEERNAEQTRLEVRYSPTLAGAMVDALPYLVDYPYGCTEQTLNRFLPTVITQQVLRKMGVDLKAIQKKRTNLNAQQLGDPAVRAKQWQRFDRNPVFDEDEVALMVKTGVRDLVSMQNNDGGWGWFSGFGERSYPHTTAVVVHGLQQAVKNGVALPEGVLENGVAWLKRHQEAEVALLQEGERHEKDPERKERYKSQADNIDALIFSVLTDAKVTSPEMQRFLYRDRIKLSLYSQALFGLALHELQAIPERDMVIKNIDQFVKVDDENQTAYIDLPNNSGWWWHWYGNQIEANAFYLKLLTKVNPQDTKASGLAKYLINNRRHGTYWNSTRDTAYVIEALAEYVVASGEAKPNMLVEVWLDGELKKSVEITPEVLFAFDNTFVLEGAALTSGKHKLELKRKQLNPQPSTFNPLYYNAYLTNFTKEDNITGTGLEIKVSRKFYKLTEDKDATAAVPDSRGQVIDQKVVKYKRHELKSLDEVVSGDLVEIELAMESKNDYEYVIFEDFKAAGFEPVDVQSGYTQGGLGAYVEFRDEKVAFFLRQLSRGTHSMSYRVRAEIPGKFSALPTVAEGMYAPELKANSDEMKIRIADKP